jgi:hypothetical protein
LKLKEKSNLTKEPIEVNAKLHDVVEMFSAGLYQGHREAEV